MTTGSMEIPLDHLVVSKLNTRSDLETGQEDSTIDDLASSIRDKGLLQPITVRPLAKGLFEVIIGQRRLLACRNMGHDPVTCLVQEDHADIDAMMISLVENVHRADTNPLDKARSLRQLYDKLGTYEMVARETSWSAQTVSKYVSPLELPEDIRARVSTADGTAGTGTPSKLARTFDGEVASEVYDKIAGFTQSIQQDILKRSEGDVTRINDLRTQTLELAFDVRGCGGRFN